jgi:hypothetical protein
MCASIAYTSITHDGTLYTSHSSMHGTQFHLGSHACVVLIDICIGYERGRDESSHSSIYTLYSTAYLGGSI